METFLEKVHNHEPSTDKFREWLHQETPLLNITPGSVMIIYPASKST